MGKYFSLILTAVVLASAGMTWAHGTGNSLEREVGEYVVDVGYDFETLVAGEAVRFDFNLLAKTGPNPKFTDVWVRIVPHDAPGILFAGNLHPPVFGLAGMSYVFPKAGKYDLAVRFQNGEEIVAQESTFSLEVGAGDKSASGFSGLNLVLAGIAGLLLGFGIAFILFRKPVYV